MDEENFEDLIADYLSGRLPKAECLLLEQRMAADPSFAKSVAETSKTYQFLEYLYYRSLRQKLTDHDARSGTNRIQSNKWIAILITLLLCILCGFVWIHGIWSAPSIATKYLSGNRIQKDQHDSLSTHELQWQIALDMYANKHYKKAWRLFIPFSTQPDGHHVRDAQWNILLCRLVLEGTTDEWQTHLDQYIMSAHGDEKVKSLEVKMKTNSWLFRLASTSWWIPFSAIKPQII